MTSIRQQQEEREVFDRFAQVCCRDIDVQTIEVRSPPEPDILCRVMGERCAYEMVELVDSDAVRRQRRQVDMQSRLLDACESLGPRERAELDRCAGNASISLRFAEHASARARELVVPLIVDLLCRIHPDFSGEVSPPPRWNGVIESMRISRPGIVGPGFSVAAAGFLRNPMISRIQAKFGKTYQSEAPIELLAYHHFRRPPIPPQFWLEPLTLFLRSHLAQSPFRRVWVFDYHDQRIDLSYP
jgi:hypothetical protein